MICGNICTKRYQYFIYATEADVLIVALFGKPAKQWRDKNPDLAGNIRDYATLQQLIVLSNMESFNAELIKKDINRENRIAELNRVAREQLMSLMDNSVVKRLKEQNNKES